MEYREYKYNKSAVNAYLITGIIGILITLVSLVATRGSGIVISMPCLLSTGNTEMKL